MKRSVIIPSDINKEDITLYLRNELGDREVIRQAIYSYLSGKSKEEIIEKCGWLSLVCGIHDNELTLKYIKDIIKVGDYGTRLGDNQLQ